MPCHLEVAVLMIKLAFGSIELKEAVVILRSLCLSEFVDPVQSGTNGDSPGAPLPPTLLSCKLHDSV